MSRFRPAIESPEGKGGDRCVDLIRTAEGWSWVECRRDAEDAHGRRRPHPPRDGVRDRAAARADAAVAVGWLTAP